MLFPTFWTFDPHCSSNINEVIAISKFHLLFDLLAYLFDPWPWNTTNCCTEPRYICAWKIVKVCQSVCDLCVKISFKHEYRRLIFMVWRHWWCHQHENTFSWITYIRSFHIRCQIEATFLKWQNFEVLANFFVGSVTWNWVCYIDSQFYYLNLELLIDAVAQILTELW